MLRKRIATSVIPLILAYGCSALGLPGAQPAATPVPPTIEPQPTYVAPTLPPAYTPTPTPTRTPTPPPSPTRFAVITEEIPAEDVAEGGLAVVTPFFFLGGWRPFESERLGVLFDIPQILEAREVGRTIHIASPESAQDPIPLEVSIDVDPAGSFRLPEGINPGDPRTVVEAMLRELEETQTEVIRIRSLNDIIIQGQPAAEVAVRTRLIQEDLEENSIWYLACIIKQETVVRIQAHSPAETGGAYLPLAERMADSFQFMPEAAP